MGSGVSAVTIASVGLSVIVGAGSVGGMVVGVTVAVAAGIGASGALVGMGVGASAGAHAVTSKTNVKHKQKRLAKWSRASRSDKKSDIQGNREARR